MAPESSRLSAYLVLTGVLSLFFQLYHAVRLLSGLPHGLLAASRIVYNDHPIACLDLRSDSEQCGEHERAVCSARTFTLSRIPAATPSLWRFCDKHARPFPF